MAARLLRYKAAGVCGALPLWANTACDATANSAAQAITVRILTVLRSGRFKESHYRAIVSRRQNPGARRAAHSATVLAKPNTQASTEAGNCVIAVL